MKDRRRRVILVKLREGKKTIWKAFDCQEFVVAKGLTPEGCKKICERKGYVVR